MPSKFSPYLYLIAHMKKPDVTGLVTSYCVPEEVENLEQTYQDWEKSTNELRSIEQKEIGIVDSNNLTPISHEKIEEVKKNPLFKNSFSNTAIDFQYIELDNLIAPQRNVSENYVEQLIQRIPDQPTEDELIDLCISPKQNVPQPKATQNQNGWIFSSPSVDFRFLGGFLKDKITEDDLQFTNVGAQPIYAITLFVGYGAGSINVFQVGNRLILNNGFHRVYSLYKKGIKKIPVVVQKIGNPALEFTAPLQGLSSDYLLKHPRPVVVKDFFNEKLTRVFKRKIIIRTVIIGLGVETNDFEV